eukprot:m.30469 g.30469  ORF g.30469 m.30469 type:complete len:556 (-) comp13860_c0_seq1:235-1902(-)
MSTMHRSRTVFVGLLCCCALFLESSPAVSATAAPEVVTVEVDVTKIVFTASPHYLSVTIDSSSLIAGPKWDTWKAHMNDSIVTALTRALSPGYLRIGGTACDVITYDMNSFSPHMLNDLDNGGWAESGVVDQPPACAPSHLSVTSPDLHGPTPLSPYILPACQWTMVLQWCRKIGLPVFFGLNLLSNRAPGSGGGIWRPENAVSLVNYTTRYFPGVVAGWELGNEPEGWLRTFNISITHTRLAADFRTLRATLGSTAFLAGPDYGIQGCISKSYPCRDFSDIVGKISDIVNISTFHFYNLGTGDTPDEFISPAILDRTIHSVLAATNANKAAPRSLPVWLGEGATASGGGIVNASGTYTATLIWMDKLGATARFGGSGLMRQSLYGGAYALFDPDTLTPRPTYWVALLFKQLVTAQSVLSVNGDTAANRILRVYARCSARAHQPHQPQLSSGPANGSVVVFGSNIGGTSQTLAFSGVLAAASMEVFLLTGKLGGSEIQLNGVTMQMDSSTPAQVPQFTGKHAAAGTPIQLAPYSSFFAVFYLDSSTSTTVSACSG